MRKVIAIILEIIPIISAIGSYLLFKSSFDIKWLLGVLYILSFLGFVFFIIARKIYNDKIIKILGFFDILSSLYVVFFYIIAIFSFGL